MSGDSSVQSELSQFRVQKARTEATLVLSNRTSVRGHFFVSGSSRTHDGPERIKDVLNAEPGFFPFEVSESSGSKTILYNRDHVVFVELGRKDEARSDPGYDVATKRSAIMLLSNGVRLRGSVSIYQPQGRDRLSDFARAAETFRYLEAEGATYLINVRHLLELAEETPDL
jgi:hypothetical protein